MGDNAKIRLTGDNADLKSALRESEGEVNRWGSSVRNVIRLVAGAFAARQAFRFTKGLVESAMEEEVSVRRLTATLKASGDTIGVTAEQIGVLADELQDLTRFGDDATRGAATALTAFGNIRGKNMTDAIRTSGDLAELLGTDLPQAAEQLGKSLSAPETGMGRLGMRIGKLSDEQEKLIKNFMAVGDVAGAQGVILEHVQAKVGGLAQEIGQTSSGAFAQMKNDLSDIGELLGQRLIDAMGDFGGTGVSAMEMLKKAVENWGETWELVVKGAQLAMVQFWEEFKHFFVSQLPEFGIDIADAISEAITGIDMRKPLLKGGDFIVTGPEVGPSQVPGGGAAFGPQPEMPIEGPEPFHVAAELEEQRKLWAVTARETTDREKELQAELNGMADKWASSIGDPSRLEDDAVKVPGRDWEMAFKNMFGDAFSKDLGKNIKDWFTPDKDNAKQAKSREETFKTTFSGLTDLHKQIADVKKGGLEDKMIEGVNKVGAAITEAAKGEGITRTVLEKINTTMEATKGAIEKITGFGLR